MSAASSDLSSLALSLTKEVSGSEEAESRDMAAAERELDSSPPEVLSEASVGGLAVLSSAATFCCGGQEAAGKVKTELLHTDAINKSNMKSAGTDVNDDLCDTCIIPLFLFSTAQLNPCFLFISSVPRRSSAGSPGSLMFVRLRVQPSAGKKKGVGGLHLGSARTLPRRDAWLALSQERYRH